MSNQENKFNPDERAARPQTIAGVLGRFFKRIGVRASDSDLVARWPDIIGPEISDLASICAVKKTHSGGYNIVLRPKNPAHTLKLSYMTEEIKKKINNYFGSTCVDKITFRK